MYTPNLSITQGVFTSLAFGEALHHQEGLVWNNFFAHYVNGTNSTTLAICSKSPCCLQNTTYPIPPVNLSSGSLPENITIPEIANCTCVNASSIYLYNGLLQDTPLFVTLTSTKINFLVWMSVQPLSLHAGGISLPNTFRWQNPWGAAIFMTEFNVTFIYQGIPMGGFAAILPPARIAPYSLDQQTVGSPVMWANYTEGTPQAQTQAAFFSAVEKGGANVTFQGALGWRMGIQNIVIPYYQVQFPIVPSAI
jgi:hypothetical protein